MIALLDRVVRGRPDERWASRCGLGEDIRPYARQALVEGWVSVVVASLEIGDDDLALLGATLVLGAD